MEASKDIVISQLGRAQLALHEAKTAQEIKHIVDVAEAARIYAQRTRLGIGVINDCTALRVYAEHKLGGMLKDTPDAKPGPKQLGSEPEPNSLAGLGLDKKLSFRSQAISELPLETIDEHIKQASEKHFELTVSQLFEKALVQR